MPARKVPGRMSGFVAGLGAMAAIWPSAPPQRYPHSSSTDALRGDSIRIGSDMQRVIDRENARIKTPKK